VLVVAGRGGPPAHRTCTRRVPDPGEVPELDARVISAGLESVVAVLRGEGVDGDDQFLTGDPQDPGPGAATWPIAARRREREPGSVTIPGSAVVAVLGVVFGCWSGAAVGGGVPVGVGDGDAPGGFRAGGGGAGQIAGEPGVDRPETGQLAGPVGQSQCGGQRDVRFTFAANPPVPPGIEPDGVPGRESRPRSRSR